MKSTAAVLVDARTIELDEFPLPPVGDDDGLLRVEATGVCGADYDPLYLGRPPLDRLGAIIPGHEVVGRVEKIGPVAAARWGVSEGDRIAVEEDVPCGRCRLCRTGQYRMCNGMLFPGEGRRYGFTPVAEPPHLWGGYSEFMYLHPNSVVHPISDAIPTVIAPLFLPIANGIEWVRRYGGVEVGGHVLVLGPGQHGLGCVVGAREAGAATIIVAGTTRDQRRLELAKLLGATHLVNVDEERVSRVVRDATAGEMATVVVDATHGAAGALDDAVAAAQMGGTVVLAGLKTAPAPLDVDKVIVKQLTLKGAYGHDLVTVAAAIRLLERGDYPLDSLCSHTYPLRQCEEAIRTAGGEGAPDPVHVTVVPGDP